MVSFWLYHASTGICNEGRPCKDLLHGNKSGPEADVAVAKVATLSKHAFGTPPGPSSPDTSNPSPAVPTSPEAPHSHSFSVGEGIFGKLCFHLSTIPGVENAIQALELELNDFLQVRKDGNLARHLSWSIDSEGPDHQKTYFATTKREPFGHSEN